MKLSTVSGVFFEIDADCFAKLCMHVWYHHKETDRISTVINGKTVYIHQLLISGEEIVDHKDRNPLNNKKDNLRPATNQTNQYNRSEYSNNTSGYKGVYWDKSVSKWCAKIKFNKHLKHLGFYATKELAAIAYNNWARIYHGQFAYQNKVIYEVE